MLASSFTDPVLGVDVHFEMVPTPAPVPTPIPNPFTGVVFDPVGLAVGLVIGAAVSAVLGAPMQGPVLYYTAFPATNTGTEAKHVPGHIIIPPGTAWAPFPKTPKPVIHPGETPKPALPVKPEDDAVCIFGSKTVTVMGSNAVRLGDIALSCGEPVRLPSSVVLAVPKGAPILVGGPPSLDILAAIMASLRTRFISDSLHAALSRLKPSRFRNFMHRAVCFFTGHPVDVASGRVMTEAVDLELPGPLPLKIERIYSSGFASRATTLGHGWSISVEQAVWTERGRVVLLAEDGREIEFDTFDQPKHQIGPGSSVHNVAERLTLHCEGGNRWRVVDHRGVTRTFAPVPTTGRSMIQSTTTRSGASKIEYGYDAAGRLEWIRDAAGRHVRFEHDARGRLTALHAPHPTQDGFLRHRQYRYDEAGDLVEVVDSLGASWRYGYCTHLLTQETDRAGTSFYFQYDGLGEDAWCVRTWGDEGIYDHVIAYDKQNKVTFVTNGRGQLTQYHLDTLGRVVKIVNPVGGETTYRYDPDTHARIEATDETGFTVQRVHDARGNLLSVDAGGEATLSIRYDEHNLPLEAVDAMGGRWHWAYDRFGRLQTATDSMGRVRRYRREGDAIGGVDGEAGVPVDIEYDKGNPATLKSINGVLHRWRHDRQGRVIEDHDADGVVIRRRHDSEGRELSVVERDGTKIERRYDPEGRLVAERRGGVLRKYEYSGRGWLTAYTEADATIRMEYDQEGLLVAVINEASQRYALELNECGEVASETDYDGAVRTYTRDGAGRIVEIRRPGDRTTQIEHDAAGRITAIEHHDGTRTELEYRADGRPVRADHAGHSIRFERDVLGRIVAETQGTDAVTSRFDGLGQRTGVTTSLGSRRGFRYTDLGDLSGLEHGWEAHPQTWQASLERDAEGQEVRRSVNGATIDWKRDAAGRPLRQQVRGAKSTVLDRTYVWTEHGTLSTIDTAGEGTTKYHHDPRARLSVVKRTEGPSEARYPDAVGNLFHRSDHRDRHYAPSGRTETMSTAGGTVAFEYDDEGNLVRQQGPGAEVWSLSWDGAGNLRKIARPDGTVVTYEYDAFARRVRRCVGDEETRWIWDGNTPCHEVRTGSETSWIFNPEDGTPMARTTPSGTDSATVVCDHAGAPTVLLDLEGEVAARMDVGSFGALVSEEGQTELCPFRFVGQCAEPDTPLVYNRYRYLHAELGHYISADPLRLGAGWERYAYVADPTRFIDPLGLTSHMIRVQLQRGRDNLSSLAIMKDSPITALEVERAMLQIIDDLPAGEGALVPRAHGAAAQLSKRIRQIVEAGGIDEGGNILRAWLDGTGVRFDVENRGKNLTACK